MPTTKPSLSAAPWLLRLEMDHLMMVDKKLEMDAIEAKIKEEFADVLTVAVSDNNARPLVARMRILEEGNINLSSMAGGERLEGGRGKRREERGERREERGERRDGGETEERRRRESPAAALALHPPPLLKTASI